MDTTKPRRSSSVGRASYKRSQVGVTKPMVQIPAVALGSRKSKPHHLEDLTSKYLRRIGKIQRKKKNFSYKKVFLVAPSMTNHVSESHGSKKSTVNE